ncbi:MAG TPA: hypothetical protein VML35_10120 [Gaiellaceae bacterium]|nr:hypothetical protein [Gaiellaceae bacterium]
MRLRGPVLLAAAVAVVLAPATLGAAVPQLFGTVGPGFTIDLEDTGGVRVTKLDPGTYQVQVRDLSDEHNFHLFGPGVNESTQVDGTGSVTWTVTLRDGNYTLLCDPHPSEMRRTFVVGTPPPPAPVPPPTTTAPPRLLATVGPRNTISLRNAKGVVLKRVKPGVYRIVVRDRTKAHNFHLVGKGVNRKSGIAFVGTTTWKVKLSAGTLRFFSDRAPKTVKGSVVVR